MSELVANNGVSGWRDPASPPILGGDGSLGQTCGGGDSLQPEARHDG